MAFKEPKKVRKLSDEAMRNRLNKMLEMREQYLADIDNCHVRLMSGNDKTGKDCYTVSLIPIVDCPKCGGCMKDCYDIRNVCYQPCVQEVRALNSAIHKVDPERYWKEVGLQINAQYATELRLNVGGDLTKNDFEFIAEEMAKHPGCDVLFFTKNDKGLNAFIEKHLSEHPDNYGFPENVKPILSRWPGMEMENPYGVPESHILWADGSTTAPEYGAYYCGGNCSDCHRMKEGCWNLKKGESVILGAH